MYKAIENEAITWQEYGLTLKVEAWGPGAVRVRASFNPEFPAEDEVILPRENSSVKCTLPAANEATNETLATGAADVENRESGEAAILENGDLRVEIQKDTLSFFRSTDNKLLLKSKPLLFMANPHQAKSGSFHTRRKGWFEIRADFDAYDDEKIFGMGQHHHGRFDQKGMVIDLEPYNREIPIPFALSSRGYGMIFNYPGLGRAEFSPHRTRWVAEHSQALDYIVITAPDHAGILSHYADITGHAPMLPEWAAGFWQCKLRYKSQDELLEIAREYKRRNLPISVIVIDFLHWEKAGQWKMDPENWPDPEAMRQELDEMGIKLVVSSWPTVNPTVDDFAVMRKGRMLIESHNSVPIPFSFIDKGFGEPCYMFEIDPSNPATREYVWSKVKKGYYQHGIKSFWLDAIEPEMVTNYPRNQLENLEYYAGPACATASLYPWYSQKLYHDGLKAEGETEIVTLGRSAYLGSQRFGAAVWSGDIHSSFEMLATSVRVGLNMNLTGIPWWTTDIGGFSGGDINSPTFRELVVRWFQYAVFCPLFRLHGIRDDSSPNGWALDWSRMEDWMFGNDPIPPNEAWSFGDEAYPIIAECLKQREQLIPYIMDVMREASDKGMPPMRPLFFAFPSDPAAADIEDQYMFGPNILVCPVTEYQARSRRVYLPAGQQWVDMANDEVLEGGQWLDADAPLERIPLYRKA